MGRYIARMTLQNSFAQEHLPQIGDFWEKIRSNIPLEYKAEISLYRFTFASFILETEYADCCREILMKAWEVDFPTDAVADIMVADFSREDCELIQADFNNFYGALEYQYLIKELYETIPLLNEKKAKSVLMWQNYLFAVDNGSGFTSLLSSLGDFLKKLGFYPEEGENVRDRSLEVTLGKETEKGAYSQDDLMDMLYEAQGDDNPYHSVGIDISYYLEGRKYDELRTFLDRLTLVQDQFVFVFRIPYLEKRAFDEIRNILADKLLLRTVQIPPLPDCVLMESVWDYIHGQNYVANRSLQELVAERFHQEKMDGRFYGFRTAEKIARELILRKNADYIARRNAGKESDPAEVDAENVDGFLDGEKMQATGYRALEEMIGMEEITDKVREIIAQVKVAISNDKLDRPCIHMRFTGAPGTGKTTVARVIGQIMREEGILRKGGFFEYSGRDLVAEYVGQTAVKTATICRDSYGSVLFIDEAYSLYEGDHRDNDFGKEALATLVAEMENHRDDMLVVMAGYTDEMEELMKANPGLRSRMPRILHFPNYTKEQLFRIFMLMVRKHFQFTPDLEEEANKYFQGLSKEFLDSKEFANARFVRNLYERTWSKAALRTALEGKSMIVLQREDFIAASSEKEFGEKIEKKKVLGF